jgi:hypothetical protein
MRVLRSLTQYRNLNTAAVPYHTSPCSFSCPLQVTTNKRTTTYLFDTTHSMHVDWIIHSQHQRKHISHTKILKLYSFTIKYILYFTILTNKIHIFTGQGP